MREIKFRAWDKRHNRFIVLEKIHFGENVPKAVYERDELSPTTPYIYSIEWIELMAYTGLKDQNGREIYEGDIVRITTTQTEETRIGEVIYYTGNAMYLVETTMGDYFTFMSQDIKSVEVLGNIHENKGLLNE